jgi:hypothetical protein
MNRWAITSSPIVDRIADLGSIFEFLRVYPLSIPKVFHVEIIAPIENASNPDYSRLKRLLNCVSLRRTKAIIELPPREDLVYNLDFDSEERQYYEAHKTRAIELLDDAVSSKHAESGHYIKVLQELNELRMFCNHGIHLVAKQKTAFDGTLQPTAWSKDVANEAFEALVCADDASCSVCGNNLFGVSPSQFPKPKLTSCLILICGSCIRDGKKHKDVLECSHNPPCPSQEVYLAPKAVVGRFPFLSTGASTKMKKLFTDLRDSVGKKR